MGIVPQQIVCNQVYPAHFPAGAPVTRVLDVLAADPNLTSPLAEITAHATLSHDRRALNERYLAELRRRAKTNVHELPMLFAPALTPAHVRALADRL
jgi:DNA-binding transcriptional ArsR family regulator